MTGHAPPSFVSGEILDERFQFSDENRTGELPMAQNYWVLLGPKLGSGSGRSEMKELNM
jgi:hypothetical protein